MESSNPSVKIVVNEGKIARGKSKHCELRKGEISAFFLLRVFSFLRYTQSELLEWAK